MATFSFEWRGEQFTNQKKAELERAMNLVALQGEAEHKVILSTPGRGRPYRRGKTVAHIASAPGDPPAPDTGRMRAATTHEVIVRGDAVIARVTNNAKQALMLELGTERIAPRPHLRPLLAKMKAVASRILGVPL
jgi:hypothetical protein